MSASILATWKTGWAGSNLTWRSCPPFPTKITGNSLRNELSRLPEDGTPVETDWRLSPEQARQIAPRPSPGTPAPPLAPPGRPAVGHDIETPPAACHGGMPVRQVCGRRAPGWESVTAIPMFPAHVSKHSPGTGSGANAACPPPCPAVSRATVFPPAAERRAARADRIARRGILKGGGVRRDRDMIPTESPGRRGRQGWGCARRAG